MVMSAPIESHRARRATWRCPVTKSTRRAVSGSVYTDRARWRRRRSQPKGSAAMGGKNWGRSVAVVPMMIGTRRGAGKEAGLRRIGDDGAVDHGGAGAAPGCTPSAAGASRSAVTQRRASSASSAEVDGADDSAAGCAERRERVGAASRDSQRLGEPPVDRVGRRRARPCHPSCAESAAARASAARQDHGLPEQPGSHGSAGERQHRRAAGRFADDRHALRVAPEGADLALHPAQRGELVEVAVVPRRVLLAASRAGCAKKPSRPSR